MILQVLDHGSPVFEDLDNDTSEVSHEFGVILLLSDGGGTCSSNIRGTLDSGLVTPNSLVCCGGSAFLEAALEVTTRASLTLCSN